MDRIESQNYVASLGLRRAPFPVGEDATPYFHTDAQKRALEAALYLARYSDLVALIHGPGGSGKSALCREIARAAGANVHVARIAGDATLNPSALCSRILESFSLVETFPQLDEQLRHIKEQIDLLQRKGYHFLLLVDDANELPNESVALLESLASLRNEAGKTVIKLVLFAPRLESLYLGGPTLRHRLKLTALAPLSAEETRDYLRHRFEHAGGRALFEQIFRARDITRIARESKGWPGAVNALAQQVLLKHVAKTDPAATPPDAPRQGRLQIALASVLGIALVAGFVFQAELTDFVATHGVQQTVTRAPAQDVPASPQESSEPTPTAAANPITDIALDMFTAPPVAGPGLADIAGPATVIEAVDLVQAPFEAAPAPTIAAAPATEAAENPPALLAEMDVVDVEVREQRWILSQNPATYTIQLVGSPDRGDVRRALKRHQFQQVTAMFETTRKDKPWYGLIYGVYPDFATANKARLELPEILVERAQIRRVSSLQGEITSPEVPTSATTDTAEVTPPPR
jgi:DamX protein